MISQLLRRQAHLLDRYWAALRGHDGAGAPPAGLDPELAALADRLSDDIDRLGTTTAFRAALRQQVDARIAQQAAADESAWTRPVIDRRRSPSAQPATSSTTDTDTEEPTMSNVTSTSGDLPVSLQQRLTREWLKIAAAVLAFLIVGTVLVLTLRDDEPSDQPVVAPGTTPTVTTSPSPLATSPATATVEAAVTAPATAPVASPTIDRTATAEATVAAQATADASLPGPGTVVAAIPVGAVPEIHAFAAGSLWVSNVEDQTISRIDVATNTVVATIPVGSPTSHPAMVAVWGDEIWVLNPADRTLLRIDPTTNTISTTIDISDAGGSRLTDPQRLAVGEEAIWVSDTQNNRVLRVDPQTQSIVATIDDVVLAHSIGATADGVWVASVSFQQIVRIDPATNQIVARIGTGDLGLNGVYVVGNEVWAGGPGHIVRIDPATNEIAESISLPEPIFFDFGGSIGVGDGSIWFVATPEMTLYRIDIATQSVTALLRHDAGFGVLYADGSLWLTGFEPDTVTRIDPVR